MHDYSSISSASLARSNAANTLQGTDQQPSAAKNDGLERSITAKNSFMGRVTNRVFSLNPARIGSAIKQACVSAIGHLLKPGAFSNISERVSSYFKNDKPLAARNVSVPPESLGSWHELETLQATLAGLKNKLHSVHENNAQRFQASLSDTGNANSQGKLKEGYRREVELNAQVKEQEKTVAGFEKRLSAQRHVPAFPIKPRPPVKPVSAQTIQTQRESRIHYQLPENPAPQLSVRDRARLQGNTRPAMGSTAPASLPSQAASSTPAANAPAAPDAPDAASSASTPKSKYINTNFDYSALKHPAAPQSPQAGTIPYKGKSS